MDQHTLGKPESVLHPVALRYFYFKILQCILLLPNCLNTILGQIEHFRGFWKVNFLQS